MAAPSARVVQAVRPHIPLIKFRSRAVQGHSVENSTNAGTALQNMGAKSASLVQSKPIGTTPRGSGIEDAHLPARYRRRPIDQVEMDYIQRGGPE